MEEKGIVADIDGDTMTVEFKRSPMCEKCGACERAHELMRMELKKQGDAAVGDQVRVELSEGALLRAALLAYGLPLALLLIGLFVGRQLPQWLSLPGNGDLYALALGLLLAGGSFWYIRKTEPRRRKKGSYTPQVVRIERLCMIEREEKNNGK